MKSPREIREELERGTLSKRAVAASESRGRVEDIRQCDVRTCFQRDIDRITHSSSFRRLMHKTQVFLQPEGDHYRTRLTHTLEVSRISRTISRALGLSEDMTEAISLGHDLGHTPFGHAGERAMDEILKDEGGFRHNEQSLRIVERIESDGRGLNLTYEVRDGIRCHTGGKAPDTLEGAVVRLADRVAYINHDLDDAIRAGILTERDVPGEITCALGDTRGERINTLVSDIITQSAGGDKITMSPEIVFVFNAFYSFMFENVYKNAKAKSEEAKVFGILESIFGYYVDNPDKLPDEYKAIAKEDGLRRAVCDYVSGMTDKYAAFIFGELFIPAAWQVR